MYIYLCANSSTSEKKARSGVGEKKNREKDKWKFRKASIEAVRG